LGEDVGRGRRATGISQVIIERVEPRVRAVIYDARLGIITGLCSQRLMGRGLLGQKPLLISKNLSIFRLLCFPWMSDI